ncbi:hypothetical protein JJQ59_23215 [Cupriavidus necator]|jgi:hypothetical protein|uniref:hypothetical protein n=1 Tax=Cupriavidus necator TaxID=106590 RepID=UPI00167AEA0A|nr:hypothetical protein [Cupriavidus necator]QQX88297.1 hypothetical protein JJQ59_23215 [Cupriavidus necator]
MTGNALSCKASQESRSAAATVPVTSAVRSGITLRAGGAAYFHPRRGRHSA